MESATASTAVSTALRRELVVDAKKHGEELRVLQQGVGHWGWSLLVIEIDSSKGAVERQGPRGKEATVPKTGRNDPCPCGSGKKYKHCCLEKDRAAELAPAVRQRVALQAQKANRVALRKDYQEELLESQVTLQQAQALDAASNAVVDLVHAGRLEEAEQAARELLVRYPEVHDGYDRLGMVHEARGQFREAADCYRKVIEFTRANPEDYDAGFVDSFLELIVKLEACAAEAEPVVNDDDRPG